jgi:hypothetical protein
MSGEERSSKPQKRTFQEERPDFAEGARDIWRRAKFEARGDDIPRMY